MSPVKQTPEWQKIGDKWYLGKEQISNTAEAIGGRAVQTIREKTAGGHFTEDLLMSKAATLAARMAFDIQQRGENNGDSN
jgi:hypothetical protein